MKLINAMGQQQPNFKGQLNSHPLPLPLQTLVFFYCVLDVVSLHLVLLDLDIPLLVWLYFQEAGRGYSQGIMAEAAYGRQLVLLVCVVFFSVRWVLCNKFPCAVISPWPNTNNTYLLIINIIISHICSNLSTPLNRESYFFGCCP